MKIRIFPILLLGLSLGQASTAFAGGPALAPEIYCPLLDSQANAQAEISILSSSSCHLSRKLERGVEKHQFETKRRLDEYRSAFGKTFREQLKNLGEQQHWIDAGSGESYALEELAKEKQSWFSCFPNKPTPQLTGVTLKMAREFAVPDEKMRIFTGRYLEDIPSEELGSADLITDYFGPLSYTAHLDEVLQKYLDLLKPNGSLFVFLNPHKTKIKQGSRTLSILQWIGSQPGIEITVLGKGQAFELKRVANSVVVPELVLSRVSQSLRPPFVRTFTER